ADQDRGVARHQLHDAERDQAHEREDRHGLDQPPDDVSPHRAFPESPGPPGAQPFIETFEKRGIRNGRKSFTFARVACTLVSEPKGRAITVSSMICWASANAALRASIVSPL